MKIQYQKIDISQLKTYGSIKILIMGLSVPEVALISGCKDVRKLFRYTHLKPEILLAKYSNIF